MEKNGISKLSVRAFDIEKDFEAYAALWIDGVCPPKESLPKNGVVIGDSLIGFLALTDCNFTIMTWYQFFEVSGIKKHRAFNDYIEWSKQVAKENGKKFIFCFSNKSGIVKILESHKFYEIEKGHFALEVF